MSTSDVYLTAARCFVELVSRIPRGRWEDPGLGDWNIRSLMGHTSRALITVETYLARPASVARVHSAAAYYAAVATARVDEAAILERGVQAGHELGDDPTAAIEALISTVSAALDGVRGAYLLDTIVGGMRLDDYLRTRTFELAVHSLDLAAACGIECELPIVVQLDAATLAAQASVAGGSGPCLILALTGRADLPSGFSVVD